MDRKEFLTTISTVKPALAGNDLIRVLTCLCFTGTDVFAYNDKIAISAPCVTDFSGGVPGATLLSFLSATRAKTVDVVSAAEGEVKLKAARARVRLPVLEPDAFVFEMPDAPEDGAYLPVGEVGFVAAVRECLRSVSNDTSVPDQLGVTLIPGRRVVTAYSTNGATLSRAEVKLSKRCALEQRVVLPTAFCEQVVRFAAGDKKASLLVTDNYALLETSSGVRVFGKLVPVERPLDFEGVISGVVPDELELVDVPSSMRLAIERALVIADPANERANTRWRVRDGVATLITKSLRGECQDKLTLRDHPDTEMNVDVQWLKVGLVAGFSKIAVTDQAVVMRSDTGLYMVAASR